MKFIKGTLSWLLYPQQSMSEVFIVFAICLISVPFFEFWPDKVSVFIVTFVLLTGTYIVGKFYFFKTRSDLSPLELKTFQFVGMALTFVIMTQYFGWFRSDGISYSLASVHKTITILFGLLLSLRALVAIGASILVVLGGRLKIKVIIFLGLIYFVNLPYVSFNKSNRLVTILATVLCTMVYFYTRSLPEAIIYGSLALDVSIPVMDMLRQKRKVRSA